MFITIDVGGTNIRVAGALDLENPTFVGEPIRRKNTHNFDDDIQFIIDAARKIAGDQPITAAAICVPGFLNKENTKITFAANLPDLIDKPLVQSLSEKLGCPVFCRTDVAVGILGEAYYGPTRRDFTYVIWGTGLGGGTVHYKNSQPEITPIDWYENFEAWEADCGGRALAGAFGKPSEELTEPEWQGVVKKFHQHLARFIETNKPSTIIFGGGLAYRHETALREAGQKHGIEIKVATFGQDSGLIGGFGLIKSLQT